MPMTNSLLTMSDPFVLYLPNLSLFYQQGSAWHCLLSV